MYLETYFETIDKLLAQIRETQREAIEAAAEAIAESLANEGALFVMDTGHMLKHEAFNRAGGMMVITPFSYGLSVECPLEVRKSGAADEDAANVESRTVALALDQSPLRKGDVLIINSNSGRTSNVIEVAMQCRDRGITVVGISSRQQMTKCPVAHPSGKKLFDVAGICIDNCGPHGDAAVEVKDNEKTCPVSGLGGAYIFWAIHADAVERLQAKGVNPTIFRSVHVSGHEYIDKQREHFRAQGV